VFVARDVSKPPIASRQEIASCGLDMAQERRLLDHHLRIIIMKISARVENRKDNHQVTLQTNDNVHSIIIPPKPTGYGSSANGGELLFLALASCYCNDIYREAVKRNIK